MEEIEPSDPVVPTTKMDRTKQPSSNQRDCYFFYYSSCNKGAACPYRHEPAALGNETVCRYWAQGNCNNPTCGFRHLELTHARNKIPCYFEKQAGGCKKVHCPFFHNNVLDQPRAEDIKKNPDLILPISRSQPGSNNTSPSSSRSQTPVPYYSNFVIRVTESESSESDSEDAKKSAEPASTQSRPVDETRLREMEMVKEIQKRQAIALGHPIHVKDLHRRKFRRPQPQPQPQPMFVDEVEDVIEEVHDDVPVEAQTNVAPTNVEMACNPVFKISVIGSFREDTNSAFSRQCFTEQNPVVPTADSRPDDQIPVVVGASRWRRGEVRERRTRKGGVASVILSSHIGTKFKPVSVQHSMGVSPTSNYSAFHRLQGRISPFGDIRSDNSLLGINYDGNEFGPSRDYDHCSTYNDRVSADLPYEPSGRIKYSGDECSERRISRALRRNHSTGYVNNMVDMSDNQAQCNSTNNNVRNRFNEKPVSSPDPLHIKSLVEIRREKAAKKRMEETSDEGNLYPKRETLPARIEMGNKRIRLSHQDQTFNASVLSHRNESLSSGTSFSSDDELCVMQQSVVDPLLGGSYEDAYYEDYS